MWCAAQNWKNSHARTLGGEQGKSEERVRLSHERSWVYHECVMSASWVHHECIMSVSWVYHERSWALIRPCIMSAHETYVSSRLCFNVSWALMRRLDQTWAYERIMRHISWDKCLMRQTSHETYVSWDVCLMTHWETCLAGPGLGYFPNASKSILRSRNPFLPMPILFSATQPSRSSVMELVTSVLPSVAKSHETINQSINQNTARWRGAALLLGK